MTATIARPWSADVRDLGDRLVTLSSQQAEELGNYLRDRHGIEPLVLMQQRPEKTTEVPFVCVTVSVFDVVLEGLIDPGVRVSVMKALRQTGRLSLQEAREVLENLPCTLARGRNREDAEAMTKTLTDAGGQVNLRERRDL